MNGVLVAVFLVLGIAFSILISYPFYHWAAAQIQNITPENTNSTRQFINVKNNTITVINTTTNEIIRTMPYSENTGNMSAENTGNMSATVNLTEKFKSLGE